jgi:3-isopropylmalate dehydrogenase
VTRRVEIAVVPGDGIGPEVVREALKVMAAVRPDDVTIETRCYDLGADRWRRTGETLPDSVLEELRGHDAILLGAVGDPSVPAGVLERGLLLRLRFELDLAINLRPVKLYEGVRSALAGVGPDDIDMVVVREGTEGSYVGLGGAMRVGTPHEIATEESVNTRLGVERALREAFRIAAARPRHHLTLVHKTNVLRHAGSLWTRAFESLRAEFPTVETAYAHADAACLYLVTQPSRFDVIVTDNLFGDIVTDLGAAITGGLGLAPSANVNVDGTAPSMFEPVHGSAPDIAGQDRADPTAAVLSVALLLRHVGLPDEADRVERAAALDLAHRGTEQRSTTEIGDALAAAVRG